MGPWPHTSQLCATCKGSLSCPLRAHEEALLGCEMFLKNLLLQDSGVLVEML
jgi:hypothetical protein